MKGFELVTCHILQRPTNRAFINRQSPNPHTPCVTRTLGAKTWVRLLKAVRSLQDKVIDMPHEEVHGEDRW